MSGGSYNYAFERIERYAEDMRDLAMEIVNRSATPNRVQLAACLVSYSKMLLKIQECLHDIEWADSGDTSDESAEQSIVRFLESI